MEKKGKEIGREEGDQTERKNKKAGSPSACVS
jgi:hypothetical protein